jgi:hypothetical protein
LALVVEANPLVSAAACTNTAVARTGIGIVTEPVSRMRFERVL